MDKQDRPNRETRIEVAPGVLKRLGDCTRADLEAAAELAELQAAVMQEAEFLADVAKSVARLLAEHDVEMASELPDREASLHRVVEDCAARSGISSELALEMTSRDLGWPEEQR